MSRRIRGVLVSGALGGLGSAVTDLLTACGVTVYAADIAEAAPCRPHHPERVVPISMDVTDEESVADAVRTIERRHGFPGLDGLVCAAGVFTACTLVEDDDAALQQALAVNLIGACRLVREAYPLLLRAGGTVVLISSESARFSMPFNGPYTISKCALEAYADCLRRELLNAGVKVAVVQPGSFKSGLLRNAGSAVDSPGTPSAFARPLATVRRMLDREWAKAMGPERAARAVIRALYARHPRPRYRVGNDPLRMALRLLPARAADTLIRRFL